MIEKKLGKIRFFNNLKVSLISGCVSLIIGFVTSSSSEAIVLTTLVPALLVSFCTGFLTPFFIILAIDNLQYNRVFKRFHILLQMVIEILLFLAIIILAFTTSSFLLFAGKVQMLIDNLPWAITIGSVIAIVIMSINTLREYLGKGFFLNLIRGLYQKVSVERAVIMFVDLRNSTRMGETLTPTAFFNLLNDFLRIVEMCCSFFKGELYKYLGDGAILVWKVTPSGLGNALNFISGFQEEMAGRAASLKEKYGMEINYTAGAHSGNVLKGGLGSEKREMGFWGDTINTASRIQSSCKKYNVSFLLSEDFKKDVENLLPIKYKSTSLRSVGETVLRGKAGTHTLFTMEMQD